MINWNILQTENPIVYDKLIIYLAGIDKLKDLNNICFCNIDTFLLNNKIIINFFNTMDNDPEWWFSINDGKEILYWDPELNQNKDISLLKAIEKSFELLKNKLLKEMI